MHESRTRRYFRHGTLPQLRVFEAVVRLGSFTRAAGALHLAQPTVSVHIRKLTETVGLPLVEIVDRRAVPTAAGRELYRACLDVFDTLSGLEARLEPLRPSAPAVPAPREPARQAL